MENIKKVPKLRFPEFSGEWEVKTLGDIGKFMGGGTPSKSIADYWQGNIPWVSSSDIVEDDIHKIKITRFINENSIKESATKIIPKESILFVSRVGVGKLAINKEEVCTSQDFTNFIPNKFDSYYLGYYFLSKKNVLVSFNQGTSIKGFTKNDIENLKLFLPSLTEQQKIADFLTQIDNKINQLSQKKQLLERYKKGVMQQIFSQSIRFTDDDWREFPEWKVKNFGDIFSFRTTNSFSRENLNYENGFVKNIHYGDIHTKFSMQFDITKEQVPFVNSEIELKRISEDNYCKNGDLIITDASEDYADIGKCIEIINLNNEKVLAGLHTILARPDLYKMYIGFSGYLMKSDNVNLQIKVIAQGSKVLSISSKRLSELKLAIPTVPEQTKIANFLTALDNKIALVEKQLNGTKQYKKGLLQQLFI